MFMQQKFDKALLEAVAYFSKKKEVVGILVAGSYVSKTLSKNSDLDLFMVTTETGWREKGVKCFNGVEVEYFLQPIKQVEKYFEFESENSKRTTLSMFSNGKVLYDPNLTMRKLVTKAKKLSDKALPKLQKARIDSIKYFVQDDLKDLEDVVAENDMDRAELIKAKLLTDLIESYFLLKHMSVPKQKHILKVISDKKFKQVLSIYLGSKSFDDSIKAMRSLVRAFLELNGGSLEKEHRIRFKTNY